MIRQALRHFSSLSTIVFFSLLLGATCVDAQEYRYAVLTGDTLILELDNFEDDSVQWYYRIGKMRKWGKLAQANKNGYSVVWDNPERIQFRGEVFSGEDNCPLYTSIIIVDFIKSLEDLENGHFYNGGLIFHTGDSLTYVVPPNFPSKYPKMRWGCYGTLVGIKDNDKIGDGKLNTATIVELCDTLAEAAYFCDTLNYEGYTDWFLPSKEELLKIFENTIISEPDHWSSTEHSNQRAWAYREIAGGPSLQVPDKNFKLKVLPVRSFIHKNRGIPAKPPLEILPYNEQQIFDIQIDTQDLDIAKVLYTGPGTGRDIHVISASDNANASGNSHSGPMIVKCSTGGPHKVYLSLKGQGDACSKDFETEYFYVDLFERTKQKIHNVHHGDIRWADYNHDGLLDFLLVGNDTSLIYQNTDSAGFTPYNLGLPSLRHATADWGDFNNDNKLDLILSGFEFEDSTVRSFLYIQNLDDEFELIETDIIGVEFGLVRTFDYNNDGTLDVMLTGIVNDSFPNTKLYRNNGNLIFEEVNTGIIDVKNSYFDFGDYDNDGWKDLAILGNDGDGRNTIIYKNVNGLFESDSVRFTGKKEKLNLDYGSLKWGDMDNDGDLDLLITGLYQDPPVIEPNDVNMGSAPSFMTFENNGSENFFGREYAWNSTGYARAYGELDIGDFDNDGLLDFATVGVPGGIIWSVRGTGGGQTGTYPDSRCHPSIYKNKGGFSFKNLLANLPIVWERNYRGGNFPFVIKNRFQSSLISLQDHNKDGKLDVLRGGGGQEGGFSALYKNGLTVVGNKIPESATQLKTEFIKCDSIILEWKAASDDRTPAHVLTYDIYIGSAPGICNIVSKLNDYELQDTFFQLNQNLPEGTYYWSVRTKDNGKRVGDWSAEQSFTVEKPTQPRIWALGDTLFSSHLSGNQWYNESGPIEGANEPYFVINENGVYYTIVTETGCLSDTSNLLEVYLNNANTPLWTERIVVYPNPFDDMLSINCENLSGMIKYKIFNSLGQIHQTGHFERNLRLNTANWNSGNHIILFDYNGDIYGIKTLRQ